MRLDKYLKVSRLIKRRTVANEACDAGRVTVNGKVAKASQDVKVGDKISIKFGDKTVDAEILSVQETVRKEEAKDMFKYLQKIRSLEIRLFFSGNMYISANYMGDRLLIIEE